MEVAEVGRRGPDIRADCFVHLELKPSGGLDIELKSKVESMYGDSIRGLVTDMLKYFGIKNAYIYLEDYRAFPWVLMARIEAAIKKCLPDIELEYLPDMLPQNLYKKPRDTFRRTRLYVPGDQPRLIINCGLYKPDGIVLDLEDSVAPDHKFGARFMVRNALRAVDLMGAERMVRINQLPNGLDDLPYVVPHNLHTVLIPKCESGDQVRQVADKVDTLRKQHKIEDEIYLIPIIESAMGVLNAYEIASASPHVVALAVGLEDLTADIGAERTKEGTETLFARQQIVIAARAAGVQPLDTVYSDVEDYEGLRASVREAKRMGFEGKGCIHPLQIRVIHEEFMPTPEEVEKAHRIVEAMEEAKRKGLGVVALGTKMIDPPVVKRALRVLKLKELSEK